MKKHNQFSNIISNLLWQQVKDRLYADLRNDLYILFHNDRYSLGMGTSHLGTIMHDTIHRRYHEKT